MNATEDEIPGHESDVADFFFFFCFVGYFSVIYKYIRGAPKPDLVPMCNVEMDVSYKRCSNKNAYVPNQ